MKLHDLRPADGSRKEKTRVGRGIAAGKGKTAGRGTKGQKARAGGTIPPWFEGGQTPLHVRIPKLRGFRNRGKLIYEIVNVGDIGAAVERGALETPSAEVKGASTGSGQITVNQDILRAVGLVRSLDKPLKILGNGELDTPLFVVADAFTASARTKIEGAGGTVSVLEVPTRPTKAIGVDASNGSTSSGTSAEATASHDVAAPAADAAVATEAAAPADDKPARPRRSKAKAEAESAADPPADADAADADAAADTDADTAVTGITQADSEAEAATTPDDAATTSDDDA
jgi:large subunit ribosomal protein L15